MRAGLAILSAMAMATGAAPLPAAAQDGASVQELTDQGYLHCSHPNVQRKTCSTVDTFEPIREGMYNSTSVTAVGNGFTLETYTPVWVADGEFCGSFREQDLMTAVVRLNGRQVRPELARGAMQVLLEKNRALIDKPFCVRFEGSGTDFVGKFTIDGVYRPEFDDPMKLIRPEDGYKLAR